MVNYLTVVDILDSVRAIINRGLTNALLMKPPEWVLMSIAEQWGKIY